MYFNVDSLKLETGWEYNLNAVKDIKGTKDFLAMDDDRKGCQIEPNENCTTRRYVDRIIGKCGCLPISMKTSYYHKEISLKKGCVLLNIFFASGSYVQT